LNQTPEEELNKIKLKHHWKIMYDKRWNLISRKEKLSEEFIETYQDEVYWLWISCCQTLSDEFIEKFIDRLDLNYLFKEKRIDIIILRKYKDNLIHYDRFQLLDI